MTHKTYFQNFFVTLCAALSDDDFLAFADTTLANLQRDPGAHADDVALLQPLVAQLRAAHQQRGPQGRLATAATLRETVKNFLAWAQLTNTTKVFPAFPNRNQPERLAIFPGGMDALYQADHGNLLARARHYLERIDIFPGGMDALYHADQANLLGRARHYLTRIGTTHGAQTKVTPTVPINSVLWC